MKKLLKKDLVKKDRELLISEKNINVNLKNKLILSLIAKSFLTLI